MKKEDMIKVILEAVDLDTDYFYTFMDCNEIRDITEKRVRKLKKQELLNHYKDAKEILDKDNERLE